MATRKKLGSTRGVSEWRDLNTAGDCKRLFKWLIHSIRDGSLETREAATMALIGSYIVKAIEVVEMEQQIIAVHRKLDADTPQNSVALN